MNYKPLATVSYNRMKVRGLKPGGTKKIRVKGRPVSVYLEPNGTELQIISASKAALMTINEAESFKVKGTTVEPITKKTTKPQKKTKKTSTKRTRKKREQPISEPESVPEPEPEEPPTPPPTPQPQPTPTTTPTMPTKPKITRPKTLSEKERRDAMKVPVPMNRALPIPTPFIDWDNIPESAKSHLDGNIVYYDYPVRGAPQGLLMELRKCFARTRKYQDKLPINPCIWGPKGTGKTQAVRKFAEEAGLPYWGTMGREGITTDELLGRWSLEPQPGGGTKDVWIDGIIPKAVRYGGLLHIDEPNLINPATIMRLNELMDNKRQLNMSEFNGEVIKAHPDFFIVLTMNPPRSGYEGLKSLPDPIKSRVTPFWLDYPPEQEEYRIVEANLRSVGVKTSEFNVQSNGDVTGRYAENVKQYLKLVRNLRGQESELSYVPSTRETIQFVRFLAEGDTFDDAMYKTIGNWYASEPEEADKFHEAFEYVKK